MDPTSQILDIYLLHFRPLPSNYKSENGDAYYYHQAKPYNGYYDAQYSNYG